MWRADCSDCHHQEHQEKSQLPWICLVPQSGTAPPKIQEIAFANLQNETMLLKCLFIQIKGS